MMTREKLEVLRVVMKEDAEALKVKYSEFAQMRVDVQILATFVPEVK